MSAPKGPDVERWIRIDDRGVTVEVEGDISIETLPLALRAMTEHPRFDPSLPTVWDFSRCSGLADFDRADVVSAIRAISGVRREAPGPRVALVAPRDVDFGMLRMFEGMSAGAVAADIAVFREGSEAHAWAFGGPNPSGEEMAGA